MISIVDFDTIPPGWYLAAFSYNYDRGIWSCALQWLKGGGRYQYAEATTADGAYQEVCRQARNAKASGRYLPGLDWTP